MAVSHCSTCVLAGSFCGNDVLARPLYMVPVSWPGPFCGNSVMAGPFCGTSVMTGPFCGTSVMVGAVLWYLCDGGSRSVVHL